MIRLLISNVLLDQILNYAAKPHAGNEAGGLLLGMRKRGAIHLTRMTLPNFWDRATPTLFERSALGHRMSALRAWKASNGTVDWVGEWHTHPFGSSEPSFIDQMSWRKIANYTKRPMAFIIGGKRSFYAGIQLPSHRSALRLSVIESDSDFRLFGVSP